MTLARPSRSAAQAAAGPADRRGVRDLPDPGAVADLVLDGGWRQHVHVHTAGDDVHVRPVDGGPLLPGALTWCPAALEWRVGARAARLDGVLTVSGGDLTLTPSGTVVPIQRREAVRVPADVPAAIVAGERRIVARTVNLSVGGMLLTGAADLHVDEDVRFALNLGGTAIAGTGHVVRGTTEGERGVAFSEIDGADERTVARFVTARQRELTH